MVSKARSPKLSTGLHSGILLINLRDPLSSFESSAGGGQVRPPTLLRPKQARRIRTTIPSTIPNVLRQTTNVRPRPRGCYPLRRIHAHPPAEEVSGPVLGPGGPPWVLGPTLS